MTRMSLEDSGLLRQTKRYAHLSFPIEFVQQLEEGLGCLDEICRAFAWKIGQLQENKVDVKNP